MLYMCSYSIIDFWASWTSSLVVYIYVQCHMYQFWSASSILPTLLMYVLYLSLSVFKRTAEAPVPHNLKGQVFIDGQVNQSAFISVSWKVGILLHIINKLYVCLGSLPHTQVTSACMCVHTHVWVCVCLFLRMHVYCTSTVRMRVCVYCKYCSACLFA